MSSINIRAVGLDKLKSRFGKLPQDIREEISEEIRFAAEAFLNRAASLAPGGNTQIRQQLRAQRVNELLYEVESGSGISAYVDFGTGAFAASYVPTLPPAVQQYARTFYINGKGTQKEKPFFFINFEKIEDEFTKNIENILKDIKL